MNRFNFARPGTLAAMAAVVLLSVPWPASAALFGGDKAPASEEAKKPEPRPPTLKETMSAVAEISRDLKEIDAIEKRLATIEKSIAGIDASLVPVGNALKPEGLRQLADLVVDTAYERAKNILMLVAAFGAVLIAFAAVMLRWSLAGRRAAPQSLSAPSQETA